MSKDAGIVEKRLSAMKGMDVGSADTDAMNANKRFAWLSNRL